MPLFKNSINGRFYNHCGPIFLESVEAPDGVEREVSFFLPLFVSFAERVSLDTFNKVLSLLFSSSVPKLVITGSEGVFLKTKNLFCRILVVALEPASYVRMSGIQSFPKSLTFRSLRVGPCHEV